MTTMVPFTPIKERSVLKRLHEYNMRPEYAAQLHDMWDDVAPCKSCGATKTTLSRVGFTCVACGDARERVALWQVDEVSFIVRLRMMLPTDELIDVAYRVTRLLPDWKIDGDAVGAVRVSSGYKELAQKMVEYVSAAWHEYYTTTSLEHLGRVQQHCAYTPRRKKATAVVVKYEKMLMAKLRRVVAMMPTLTQEERSALLVLGEGGYPRTSRLYEHVLTAVIRHPFLMRDAENSAFRALWRSFLVNGGVVGDDESISVTTLLQHYCSSRYYNEVPEVSPRVRRVIADWPRLKIKDSLLSDVLLSVSLFGRPFASRVQAMSVMYIVGATAWSYHETMEDRLERRARMIDAIAREDPKHLVSVLKDAGRYLHRRVDLRRDEDIRDVIGILCELSAESLGETRSLTKLLEKAGEYHREILQRKDERFLNGMSPDTKVAAPPIDVPAVPGLTFLATMQQIIDEGKLMGHCVALYTQSAHSGHCFLFHFKDGKDMGTAQVSRERGDTGRFRVVQSYGPRNSRNKASRKLEAILTSWCGTLNAHEKTSGMTHEKAVGVEYNDVEQQQYAPQYVLADNPAMDLDYLFED